jgi:hypothetical protein
MNISPVHTPGSFIQRGKAVFFPGNIPVHEDVPIIDVKQFKTYKINKGVKNG